MGMRFKAEIMSGQKEGGAEGGINHTKRGDKSADDPDSWQHQCLTSSLSNAVAHTLKKTI